MSSILKTVSPGPKEKPDILALQLKCRAALNSCLLLSDSVSEPDKGKAIQLFIYLFLQANLDLHYTEQSRACKHRGGHKKRTKEVQEDRLIDPEPLCVILGGFQMFEGAKLNIHETGLMEKNSNRRCRGAYHT